MSALKDLAGQRFGRLLVVARAENYKTAAQWSCRCECGNVKVIQGYSLRAGTTTSCGCRQREIASTLIPAAVAVAVQNRRNKPADKVSYRTAHKRVERAKGKASEHACMDCGQQAQDWSLRHDAPVTHEGNNGGFSCRYSGNPDDYEPRCKACHATYDRE